MIVRDGFSLPDDKRRTLRRAIRLEWWTLGWLLTITAVMYLSMGGSQAMKTAWVEDILSLIPPILFLVAVHFHDKPASHRFPYGHRRSLMIAFLGASFALLLLGGFLLFEAAVALVRQEHPTIGLVELFGHELWLGWVMIAALAYSILPPVILGRKKLRLAEELHEKTLHVDAAMNKADWMTAAAAILGILGVGAGLWWADSAAAAFISLDIVWDGLKNVRTAVGDLMDQSPTELDGSGPDGIADVLRGRLQELPWVERADLRLRDEDYVVSGEAYVVPRDTADLLARLEEAEQAIAEAHWRSCDIVVVPLTDEKFEQRHGELPGS